MCDSKKSFFFKEQEAIRLLSKLAGIKVLTLSELPIADFLFQKYKRNAIVYKLLLAADKFMKEIKQRGFTYNVSWPFTINKEKVKKATTGFSKYIYQKKLDKACFNTIWRFQNRRAAADKV